MRPLSELIRRRQELKVRLDKLTAEMDAIDRELLPRIGQLAAAIESPPSGGGTGGAVSSKYFGYLSTGAFVPAFAATPQPGTLSNAGPNSASEFSFTGTPLLMQSISANPHRWEWGTAATERPHTMAPIPYSSAASIVEAVKAILSESGRPLKTGEIFHQLYARNVILRGKNPRNTLSAHLSNAKHVFASTDDGWTLRNPDLLSSEGRPAQPA